MDKFNNYKDRTLFSKQYKGSVIEIRNQNIYDVNFESVSDILLQAYSIFNYVLLTLFFYRHPWIDSKFFVKCDD